MSVTFGIAAIDLVNPSADVAASKFLSCSFSMAGMLLTLSFVPYDFKIIFLGFLFFRILDTLKPFPAMRIQNMHGAVGIIGDDLVAGIYSALILQVILKFPS